MKTKYFEQLMSRDRFAVLVLVGLGCGAYVNAVFHPFVHDDFQLVVNNPNVQHWNWRMMFLQKMDFGAANDLSRPYYRPMLEVIQRSIFSVFGANPAPFHAFNIILHVINSWLVFQIIRRVLQVFTMERMSAHLMALMVAVLFLIHPVQTQAVACVSGISNLAVTFFCLMAFWLYLLSDDIVKDRRWLCLFAMSVSFILALLCKEQALVFPGLVIWHEWCQMSFQKDRENRWPIIFKMAALFLCLIAGYVMFKRFFVGVHTFTLDPTAGGMSRILAIPHILFENIRILFLPYDLHYFRSLDLLSEHHWPTLILIVGLIGVMYGSKFLRSSDRGLLLWGLGWFVIAQMATIQILPLFWEYSHMSTAEHFLYFPSIGMFLVVCVGAKELHSRVSRSLQKFMIAGGVIVMTLLMVLTIRQNTYWASETILFERAAHYEPRLGRLQHVLAQVYFYQERYLESIAADTKAQKIMAEYESVAIGEIAKNYYRMIRADTMMSLGLSHRMMRDSFSAVAWMEQAVNLEPNNADHRSTLGVMYAEQKDFERAFAHLKRAVELAPDHVNYLRNFALLLSLQGRADEARGYFKRVLELNSGDALARAYMEQNK